MVSTEVSTAIPKELDTLPMMFVIAEARPTSWVGISTRAAVCAGMLAKRHDEPAQHRPQDDRRRGGGEVQVVEQPGDEDQHENARKREGPGADPVEEPARRWASSAPRPAPRASSGDPSPSPPAPGRSAGTAAGRRARRT